MAGRKNKPTLLKLLDGNPGHKPLPKNEVIPQGDIESPPDWLTPSQREIWEYAVDHSPAGLLKSLDFSMMLAWTLAYDALKETSIKMQCCDDEEFKALSRILAQQSAAMIRAAGEMGFSPASRAKVSVTPNEKQENEFAKFKRG